MAGSGTPRAEHLVDALVERDVFIEAEDGELSTTVDFEDTRGIYYDSYMDLPEGEFVETVAELFELDASTAEARIEEFDVTREQLVTYLALQTYLEEPPAQPELAAMARIAAEVGMDPVPPDVRRVDDEYEAFLDEHPGAVLVVLSYPCTPCEELKREFDEIRAAVPDGVAFAGVDGHEAADLRETFEVEAAPTTLVFRKGELVETVRGYHPPAELAETFESVYG